MKTPRVATSIPGFEEVRDLIPDGLFLRCTDIWRMSLEHYRDEFDDLRKRMVLELVSDIQDGGSERVAVIMESPSQISFPDSWQILGLAFENIQDQGWEGLRWRVYDYEMSGFQLYCVSLRFERRRNTEPGAAPNGGPANPRNSSAASEGPPSGS